MAIVCFEGNAVGTECDSSTGDSNQEIIDCVGPSRGSVCPREMSEAPVSFVVGEPELDPDPDPSEVQEIEDSFPSEGSDSANLQMQNNVTPGLLERRKRLR